MSRVQFGVIGRFASNGRSCPNTSCKRATFPTFASSLKGVVSETIITTKIAPTYGQFQPLRVLVLLEFGVQRARFDKVP